ncbi:aldehyde dehydrogenase family protein [Streptomyces sp. NPDC092369]
MSALRALPRSRNNSFALRRKVVRKPLGVVLVIVPWNYPLQ